jgi:hypothetical protein
MAYLDPYTPTIGAAGGAGLLGNPAQAGLLTTAFGLLSAGGPSTTPIGLGQAVGKAGLLGMQAYQSALDNQMKRQEQNEISEYRKAQAAQINQKVADQKELSDFFAKRLGVPQPGTMPSADWQASTQALGQGAQVGDIGPTVTNAARMDAIRPASIQGPNSAFPFSLNDVAFLKTKGVDLSDVYKLATDPIQLAGGNVYKDRVTGTERYIPKLPDGMTLGQNGAASVVPGFIRGNNAIKGGEAYSQELGKAQVDPFYGVDSEGNKVLLGSRAGALGLKFGFNGDADPSQQPGGQGSAFGRNPVVTERNPGAVSYDTDMGKAYAERYKAINNAGFLAPTQIAKLQRIGQLLDDHDGGKFSNNGLALAQYANSLGIKIDPKLGNKEAAAALSNEVALTLRDPSTGAGMPGAMSDADRQFLASMAPGLGQSKEGRQQMINAGVALQKRNMQVMQMASKYQRKYGRVDDGFYTQLQDWADRNPLFGGQ